MPAATTHVAFAKDVLRLDSNLHIDNLPMFLLGSQGPDLLFFSRASILPGSLKKYGNLMHEHKVYEVIHYFEKHAGNDRDLISYIKGYLCHYALDSTVHPLVYAVTSSICGSDCRKESEVHVGLEADIDVWILHQRGKTIHDYDVFHDLKVSEKDRKKLAEMYHAMFRDVLHLNIPERQFRQTITEISFWTGFIRPREGVYHVIHACENVIGNHAFSNMMLCNKKDERIINMEHKPYTVPWPPHTVITASFPELYGKAFTKACRLIGNHTKSDFLLDFNGEETQFQNREI